MKLTVQQSQSYPGFHVIYHDMSQINQIVTWHRRPDAKRPRLIANKRLEKDECINNQTNQYIAMNKSSLTQTVVYTHNTILFYHVS